ncbi:hypothetical protein HXX76_007439 [Chlamydomonas incerta]|uniref:Dynamin-related GTPase n=1 Tax=Chlamydomonas incerta TaxID=51695 RepID=A0A835TBX4_CHLIN|nr:hypothetical protein HXX76_007439 [Chlamydomonas incerta]|eukprot:KAG2435366.1 hypothetical protein HXX76_007439 [Chlamydomonas incerta]
MAALATQLVDAPTAGLEQVLYRLQEKRIALERVVLQYGEAPAGIKEVFELCRGFERAYTNFINESPVASKIKEAFLGEKGLAGKIKKLPMDKVYDVKNVKSACRQADGYQMSLVAPEKGLRLVTTEALDFVTDPVNTCVQEVYNLLVNAAREAAEKAGTFTEAALMGAMPMYVPDFKNVVMPAIVAALDEWKKESEKMAHMLVDMEKSYVTAGFFRHTTHHRYQRIKQQEQMRAAMQAKGPGQPEQKGPVAAVKQTAAKFFPSFGPAAGAPAAGATPPGTPAPNGVPADDDSDDGKSPPKTAGGAGVANVANADDFIAGYFDKYVSDDSARFLESMKWQRRFFVFSESQRVLYYFKSPEDVSKPSGLRGQVNIAECIVEDLDDKGNARPVGAGPATLNPLDKGQLMIRIRHKDPRGVAVKDHNAIIMRAENIDTKMTWLAKLRKAAEPRRPGATAAAGQAGAAPAAGAPAAGGAAAAAGGHGSAPSTTGPSVSASSTMSAPSATAVASVGGFGGFAGAMDEGDLSWAKDAEPVLDTHLGEGSSAFRADGVRDSEGHLLPAPPQLLNPLRLKERMGRAGGALTGASTEARWDALLDQTASDMSLYMGCIQDTIIITVPKAIVHCMIRKSEKNLLERLFTVIHHLTPTQLANLLKEDEPIIEKRKAARAALEDVKTAIFQLQQVLERQNMAAPGDRKNVVQLQALVFAYAGIKEKLTPEQYKYFDERFCGQYAPECVRFNWFIRPMNQPPQLGGPPRPGGPPGPPGGVPPGPGGPPGPGHPPGPPGPGGQPGGPMPGRPAPGGPMPSGQSMSGMQRAPAPGGPMPSGPSMSGQSMSGLQRPPGAPPGQPQRAPPPAPGGAPTMGQPMGQRRPPPPPPGTR